MNIITTQKIKKASLVFGVATMLLFGLSVVVSPYAGALASCSGNDSYVCTTTTSDLTTGILKNVINTLLSIAGIIAVIVIVVGGIRYTTSDGDASKASQAKNTIIYALVGLVVAVMSFAMVNFVLGKL